MGRGPGFDDEQWSTVRPAKRLLVAVHNVTAATRLLDVLPLIAADHRIAVDFTVTGSSAFTEGTERFLVESGMRPVDWANAVARPKDLVLAASHGGDLRELGAPLIIVPHGIGYNKYLSKIRKFENSKIRKSVFGLSGEWLLDAEGALIPSALVLSHVEQLDRLTDACPQAAPVAVLAGDPCFDRMLASVPLRGVYRRALGAVDRTLVVVSSTWGAESLYGQDPGFVARLAARLPVDQYRVVLVLHPNVVAWHSRWQVEQWLRDCRRAGVVVLDPVEGWRAALVAADLVIGDHGSVTFYAAALGRPIALATAPHDTVDPASAIGRMLRAAPRFDVHADPADEIDGHVDRPVSPELAEVAELVSSDPGASADLLRAALYRLIDLPEPPHGAETTAVPVPRVAAAGGLSHLVAVTLDESGPVLTAEVRRFPASLVLPGRRADMPPGAHLVVGTGEPHRRWLELAEIVVLDEHARIPDAEAALAALPGCLLAVVPDRDGWAIVGGGQGVRVRQTTVDEPHPDAGALCASVVQHWLTLGRTYDDLPDRLHLQIGGTTWQIELGG